MSKIIEMKNICKSYEMAGEPLPVLKNIDLTVNEGEYVAILGPSGSGKSTLMNIIGCMDKANEGEYYLNGTATHSAKEKHLNQIRNKEIGFIFQKYHLIPTYTVLQNITMPLLTRGET